MEGGSDVHISALWAGVPPAPWLLRCPAAMLPQAPGRWTVRIRTPRLGRGGTVLGVGPGVRPCSGSDSQRPPVSPEGGRQRRLLALLPAPFWHHARDSTGGQEQEAVRTTGGALLALAPAPAPPPSPQAAAHPCRLPPSATCWRL